jgi:thiamine pyrophosphate-dependent acetolactate synthase large subunit-like protein
MSRTVARLLAESLEAHDVDQIYCVPGESSKSAMAHPRYWGPDFRPFATGMPPK